MTLAQVRADSNVRVTVALPLTESSRPGGTVTPGGRGGGPGPEGSDRPGSLPLVAGSLRA